MVHEIRHPSRAASPSPRDEHGCRRIGIDIELHAAKRKVDAGQSLFDRSLHMPARIRAQRTKFLNCSAQDRTVGAPFRTCAPQVRAGMALGIVETHSRLITARHRMEVHLSTPKPTLIAPHGGTLVDRVAKPGVAMTLAAEAATAPKIALSDRALCDVICIATGAYSPLEGFMDSADYNAVIDGMRLSNGTIWPMPIVLPIEESLAGR